jgi:hypothetical protein
MKYTEFTYTDAKGKVTDRKVLVIQEPSNKLMGIDVSEVSEEYRTEFMEEYNILHKRFLESVDLLKSELDLTHSFRQFIDTNISNRK